MYLGLVLVFLSSLVCLRPLGNTPGPLYRPDSPACVPHGPSPCSPSHSSFTSTPWLCSYEAPGLLHFLSCAILGRLTPIVYAAVFLLCNKGTDARATVLRMPGLAPLGRLVWCLPSLPLGASRTVPIHIVAACSAQASEYRQGHFPSPTRVELTMDPYTPFRVQARAHSVSYLW
jgi:hypothetical protein